MNFDRLGKKVRPGTQQINDNNNDNNNDDNTNNNDNIHNNNNDNTEIVDSSKQALKLKESVEALKR